MKTRILTLLLLLSSLSSLSALAQSIDQTLSWPEPRPILIEVPRGELTLVGRDSDAVQIQGQLDKEASEFLFVEQADQLLIKVILPQNWQNQDAADHSKLTIRLPSRAEVRLKSVSTDLTASALTRLESTTVSGDLSLNDSQGDFRLTSVSGDIELTQVGSQIWAESVSGDIEVQDAQGKLKLKSVSGDMTLARVSGMFELESVSGEITAEIDALEALKGRSVSGDLTLEWQTAQPEFVLSADSVSGDIQLSTAPTPPYRVMANTGPGGKITNRWSQEQPIVSKYGRNQSLQLNQAQPDRIIKLNTVSGTLGLYK
ncbi:DUF4097 family beta strand repeat-containing protein [Ferrimonas pelagia]|uniref:DUF4097 family beta strand repeat-containing protein n=1 Tax=Ferrimonas pelagia TaxID=1177826 RepID=A0ABP9F9S3_9GAMM